MADEKSSWREDALQREKQFRVERARAGEQVFMYDDGKTNLMVWVNKILSHGIDTGLEILVERCDNTAFLGGYKSSSFSFGKLSIHGDEQIAISNQVAGKITKVLRDVGIHEDDCKFNVDDHAVRRFLITSSTVAKRDAIIQKLGKLLTTECRMEELTRQAVQR